MPGSPRCVHFCRGDWAHIPENTPPRASSRTNPLDERECGDEGAFLQQRLATQRAAALQFRPWRPGRAKRVQQQGLCTHGRLDRASCAFASSDCLPRCVVGQFCAAGDRRHPWQTGRVLRRSLEFTLESLLWCRARPRAWCRTRGRTTCILSVWQTGGPTPEFGAFPAKGRRILPCPPRV